jgi:hypothetical protein
MLELENLEKTFKAILVFYSLCLLAFLLYAVMINQEMLFLMFMLLAFINISLGLTIVSILDKLRKIK